MFYEPELIDKQFNEILKNVDFIENKGTDPQSLFVYFRGLGLLTNIKTYFKYKKFIKIVDKIIETNKAIIAYDSSKKELDSKQQTKRLAKITKSFDKTHRKAKKIHEFVAAEKEASSPDSSTKNTDKKTNEQLIVSIADNNDKLIALRSKLVLIYKATKAYLRNTLTVALMPFTIVAYGLLALLLNNNAVNIASTAVALGCWTAYLTLRIIYLVKFIRNYRLDKNAAAIKLLYHLSFILAYLTADLMICFECFNYNTVYPATGLLAACGILILAFFYDIFCSSKFFAGQLNYGAFAVVIGLILSVVLLTVKNVWVTSAVSGFLISVEAALVIMIFKAFIIDQRKIETALQILCLLAIVLMCIGIGVVLIYHFTWKTGDGNNTLFSSIMGVYAALIGGILTFTGVAWTIRHSEKQRKADEKLRSRPYIVLTEKTSQKTPYIIPFADYSSGNKKTVINKIYIYVTDAADCVCIGLFINDNFYPSEDETYLQRDSYHVTRQINLNESIQTNEAYFIVKDMLDNLYSYKCVLKEDNSDDTNDCKNYKCTDIGVPMELTAEQIAIINKSKKASN